MSTGTAHTIPDAIFEVARKAVAQIRPQASKAILSGQDDDLYFVPIVAKAINDAVMAERERCAKIADEAAAGRDWQRSDANAHNDKRAARDFETMKFEAIEIASAIRQPFPAAPKAES